MNVDILYISCIVLDDTFECETLEVQEPSKRIYIKIGIKYFTEGTLSNPKYNQNTLYILKNGGLH